MHKHSDETEQAESGSIRSLLPVALVGFVIVVIAMVLLLWPTGNYGEDVSLIPHIARVLRSWPGLGVANRILDVGIYVVILAGIFFLATAWRRPTRNALIGLIAVSILGLSYVSGMALYTGPMVATCGFLLVLFGALVAWTTTRDHPQNGSEDSREDADKHIDQDAQATTHDEAERPLKGSDTSELGMDENAPHPVA